MAQGNLKLKKHYSKEFPNLPKEERVRILMNEEFLSEREARRFLAIGAGELPTDERRPGT